MSAYQPKTGERCSCRPGLERDNCPACEGTGQRIDFAAIRARVSKPAPAIRFRYYKGVRYVAPWKPAPAAFARCNACGRAWDDDKSTGLTPTPAGRCPFEYWHKGSP